MAAGYDLLFRRAGREFKNTDSVFRHQGQERGKRNFAMTERQMVLLGTAAIVNVGAKQARRAKPQGLDVIVPAQELLCLGMAEIVPVPDHFGGKGGQDLRKFLLVGKLLEGLPDFKAKADFQFSRQRDDG